MRSNCPNYSREKESHSYAARTPQRVTYPDNATLLVAHRPAPPRLMRPLAAALVITNLTDDLISSTPQGPSL